MIHLQPVIGNAAQFARRILAWYERSRRDLPWRPHVPSGRQPTAYHVMVSELMLQQTQVATVIPYFHRFVERFPDIATLAAADEQDVLRLWQGLGYYSRARNLLAAARVVLDRHQGDLPDDPNALLALPGIGRYTAGAIASIAFNRRAPILDGNVMRVLCRIDRIMSDPRERLTQQRLWQRATEILPSKQTGNFNSSLMELGAMVCTPRTPNCLVCPVQQHCEALAAGVQDQIPTPRKAQPTPLLRRHVFCIARDSHWLIEQRPPTGRWAGMWQFITRESLEAPLPVSVSKPRRIGSFEHQLTHRRYRFNVYTCNAVEPASEAPSPNQRWVKREDLTNYPRPRPHLKVAQMLDALGPIAAKGAPRG